MDTKKALITIMLLLPAGALAAEVDWTALRGVNYFTSAAANAHEMWTGIDDATVSRELTWARGLGFNSLRLWLSFPAFASSRATFEKNLNTVLELAAQRNLTAILVLFDNCGISAAPDGVEMSVNEAYHRFLRNPALSAAEKQRITRLYSEFAEGRGKEMFVKVGRDTPADIIFWQHWSPNPGLERMRPSYWTELEKYVDAVAGAARLHPNVIALDLFNEPGVLLDLRPGTTAKEGEALTSTFIEHFAQYLRKQQSPAAITIGSESLDRMKSLARYQDVLSVHTYQIGERLDEALRQAKEAARSLGKPILVTECLANTDDWFEVRHGEESRSTDEAQLRHYQDNLPRLLESGLGWYSWGFIAGRMFTPFTDILYPSGYRRPAAVYLNDQLHLRKP